MKPMVSVVMPVFNAEKYLDEAIQSIREQSYENFELIAIDDGSTDKSLEILARHRDSDSRVRIISRANTGIVGALNDGIEKATGTLVARMDADDVAHPDRFMRQVAYLERSSNCVIVGTAVTFTCPFGVPHFDYCPPVNHGSIERELLIGNGGAMIHPSVVMRLAAVEAIGGYRKAYEWNEDLDLFLRLGKQGDYANLSDVLLFYRRHPQAVTATRKHVQNQLTKRAVREALVDRGLDAADTKNIVEPPEFKPVELYRRWGWNAIKKSYPAVARAHAFRALKHSPVSMLSWKLLMKSIFGCQSRSQELGPKR